MFVATVVPETRILSKNSWHTGLCLLKKFRRNQVKIFLRNFLKFSKNIFKFSKHLMKFLIKHLKICKNLKIVFWPGSSAIFFSRHSLCVSYLLKALCFLFNNPWGYWKEFEFWRWGYWREWGCRVVRCMVVVLPFMVRFSLFFFTFKSIILFYFYSYTLLLILPFCVYCTQGYFCKKIGKKVKKKFSLGFLKFFKISCFY
jgi:hypothetical protein